MRGAQGWWWCCKSAINLYICLVLTGLGIFLLSPPVPRCWENRKNSSSVLLPLYGAPAPATQQQQKHMNQRQRKHHSVSFKMSRSVPCFFSVYFISFASLYVCSVTPVVTVERDNDRRQSKARSKRQSKNRERVRTERELDYEQNWQEAGKKRQLNWRLHSFFISFHEDHLSLPYMV